jgi:hypothetical protein
MNYSGAAGSAPSSAGYASQPLLESDQTRVRLLRVEKIGLGIARIVLKLQGRGAAPTFAAGSTGWI